MSWSVKKVYTVLELVHDNTWTKRYWAVAARAGRTRFQSFKETTVDDAAIGLTDEGIKRYVALNRQMKLIKR